MSKPTRRYLSAAAKTLIRNAQILTAGAVAVAAFTASATWGSGGTWLPIDAYLVTAVMVLSTLAVACLAAALVAERRMQERIAAATAPPAAARVVEVDRGTAEGVPGPLAAIMAAARPAQVVEQVPVPVPDESAPELVDHA